MEKTGKGSHENWLESYSQVRSRTRAASSDEQDPGQLVTESRRASFSLAACFLTGKKWQQAVFFKPSARFLPGANLAHGLAVIFN